MPILVKDYTWTESKDSVHVTVPLKGVKKSNVGLMCTNEFLKANFPPFLFEVLLYKDVDDAKSSAKIRDGSVEFRLVKSESEIWGRLDSEKSDDKAFVLKKKLEAVEYVQKQTEEQEKEKLKVKTEDKRYTVKEMMKLEEEEKARIEMIKESERKRTEEEMETWRVLKKAEEEKARMKMFDDNIEEVFKKMDEKKVISGKGEMGKKESPEMGSQEIFADVSAKDFGDGFHDDGKEVVEQPKGLKPRQSGKITFKFTPRVFPTPLRESKTLEEDEWLQKQADARKTKELDDSDLEEHEKDPEWLKDKGNKLFASGNFLAAVNAYNLAIRLRPKMHILYLNRAACHLKLRNFYKCIDDCSVALDLLNPPVPANAKARLKAHVRRGTAFCELEIYAEGLLDYNAALKIDPNNEGLKNDAKNIKDIIEKGDEESTVISGTD